MAYTLLHVEMSLIIVPVLSVGANQHKQVIDKTRKSYGQIFSIKLYEIKNPNVAKEIIKRNLLLANDTQKNLLIFSFLHVIADNPHWKYF